MWNKKMIEKYRRQSTINSEFEANEKENISY